MATCIKKGVCSSSGFLRTLPLIYQQVRFGRNRPNIQKPRPPHFLKLKFLTVAQHTEPEDLRPPEERCLKPQQETPPITLDALDKIYAEEVKGIFQTSKLTAILARTSWRYDDLHQAKILFFKANMKVLTHKPPILKAALDNTEFRNLLPLFEASTILVYSSEENIPSLVQINRKLQHFQLLCAVVDRRILSVSQLEALSHIPDIDSARAGIAQTLLSQGQSIVRGLETHQMNLVQQLNQRIEQLNSSEK